MTFHETVDLELEQTARQEHRAGDVPALEFGGLPYVDQQRIRACAVFRVGDGAFLDGRFDATDEISVK